VNLFTCMGIDGMAHPIVTGFAMLGLPAFCPEL
jgi:hypothetical protein